MIFLQGGASGKRVPCPRTGLTGGFSEHRQRASALEHDPGAPAGQAEAEKHFHPFAGAQHHVVHVRVEASPIALRQKTGEARVPKSSARIPPQAEANGRAVAEI